MYSYPDAILHIEWSLGEFANDYDIEAIANHVWEEAGTWDMTKIGASRYWQIVDAHQIN